MLARLSKQKQDSRRTKTSGQTAGLMSRRRLFGRVAGVMITAAGARAQNPGGQPGLVCGYPTPPLGAQLCETGIPTTEIEGVIARQEMSQWCWAAALEMIFNYYGIGIEQQQIVRETFGVSIDLPAAKEVILRNVNRVWGGGGGRFLVRSDFTTITPDVAAWELSAKRPLIVGTLGHAMVMTAMAYSRLPNGAGTPLSVTVGDPWPSWPNIATRGRRVLTPPEMVGMNDIFGGICFRVRAERV